MSLNRPTPSEEEPSVQIKFTFEDPHAMGQTESKKVIPARLGDSVLGAALDAGIEVEHACGGVCACSTCHIYVKQGESLLSEADDDELDRVEEAAGLQMNSRLSCRTVIEENGEIHIIVPAWNRNAVKEQPH